MDCQEVFFLRKKIELVVVILLIFGLVWLNKSMREYVASDKIEQQNSLVVIDPGHGGTDPGKVGVNNVLEKDINLEIAKRVKKYLEKKKIDVILTREEDVILAAEDSSNKKIEDMKERVRIINESSAVMAISIHQNSYQDAGVKGAQVFYFSHSKEGEKLAEIMQKALLKADETNTRMEKANDTYYLLKRTMIPTVIVECGFLSNAKEAEMLSTEEYQDEISKAIVDGIITCLSE